MTEEAYKMCIRDSDFYIGEGADVVVVAGCGIHADGEEEARHNGIHRFFLGKGAKVVYEEKHVGTGKSTGNRHIDPVTEAFLEEDSSLTMDTVQISGVDTTYRKTSARPVSYTHLDVYKRQRIPFSAPKKQTRIASVFFFSEGFPIEKHPDAGGALCSMQKY